MQDAVEVRRTELANVVCMGADEEPASSEPEGEAGQHDGHVPPYDQCRQGEQDHWGVEPDCSGLGEGGAASGQAVLRPQRGCSALTGRAADEPGGAPPSLRRRPIRIPQRSCCVSRPWRSSG